MRLLFPLKNERLSRFLGQKSGTFQGRDLQWDILTAPMHILHVNTFLRRLVISQITDERLFGHPVIGKPSIGFGYYARSMTGNCLRPRKCVISANFQATEYPVLVTDAKQLSNDDCTCHTSSVGGAGRRTSFSASVLFAFNEFVDPKKLLLRVRRFSETLVLDCCWKILFSFICARLSLTVSCAVLLFVLLLGRLPRLQSERITNMSWNFSSLPRNVLRNCSECGRSFYSTRFPFCSFAISYFAFSFNVFSMSTLPGLLMRSRQARKKAVK